MCLCTQLARGRRGKRRRAHQASFVFPVFVQERHQQVVLPLGFLQLPEKQETGVSKTQTLPILQTRPAVQPSHLAAKVAAAPTGRGCHGAEPVHLLLLLLPHAALRVAGDVQVWQLLQEQRKELVLPHFHCGGDGR